jgi:rSAM/selenodomain-associated transferase 2
MISAVIPTLDSAETLFATLASLAEARKEGLVLEVIVADGGSADQSKFEAEAVDCRIVEAPLGRGAQLAAGAAVAEGDWLLFLHADTVLGPGWEIEAVAFLAEPRNKLRAAVFGFVLDDESDPARRLEAMVNWRCRVLGLPYGDQGLLIAREFYERLGGFRPLAVMEDVDMVRRIGRGNVVVLGAGAITSAERYRRGGYLLRPLRNLFCLALYFLRFPSRLIAWIYG